MRRYLTTARALLAAFWFLPTLIGVAFALTALLLLQVDHLRGDAGIGIGFGGDADAAQGILTVVAGSLITVMGLTLSLTVVTLQLVSGQFTPRALRGLLSDRVTQILSGTFVGIVAYALIVLRSIRAPAPDGSGGFVPSLATTAATIFALSALGLLLYFVHHIGRTIEVSSISARIYEQTMGAVERIYPDGFGTSLDEERDPLLAHWREGRDPFVVTPVRAGYIQDIAAGDIARVLGEGGARVALAVRPGDFVTEQTPALEVWGARDAEHALLCADALVIDDERDIRQDAAFGLRQLVDIALRALSPGVNDPTTAVTCIGYLGAVLERLAGRDFPAPVRRYDSVTILARRLEFSDLMDLAIIELGRFSAADARVSTSILDALYPVAREARRVGADDRILTVSAAARRVSRPALEDARTNEDRELLQRALERIDAIAEPQPPG